MNKKIALGMVILLLLGIAAAAEVKDLGQVRIPTAVMLKGELIQPGTYTFSLEKTGGDLTIVLMRDGDVVASELAITRPTERQNDPARIAYQPLKQDGGKNPMSRILCSYRGTLYLLYFDKP